MNTSTNLLNKFYQTNQGLVIRNLIASRIADHWPSLHGIRVLALGYTKPWYHFLTNKLHCTSVILACTKTPNSKPSPDNSHNVICEKTHLPLTNQSCDRALLIHAFDNPQNSHALLREVWRVTSRSAHILIVAANRLGLWTLTDTNAFAQYCTPLTRNQLETLLIDAMFTPCRHSYALHAPSPLYHHASFWDIPLRFLGPPLASTVIIEAHKTLCVSPQQLLTHADTPTQPLHGTPIASLSGYGTQTQPPMAAKHKPTLVHRPPSGITPHRSL